MFFMIFYLLFTFNIFFDFLCIFILFLVIIITLYIKLKYDLNNHSYLKNVLMFHHHPYENLYAFIKINKNDLNYDFYKSIAFYCNISIY